mmetsp:Transcript_61863/g.137859  ORF Transcript_61863/g.137859 Transcript_61863/m.137859 type:complete len:231 (+) Transcript_61863:394-1086(+)
MQGARTGCSWTNVVSDSRPRPQEGRKATSASRQGARLRRRLGRLALDELGHKIVVGINTHVGCDVHRLPADGLRVHPVDVDERASSRSCKLAAGTNPNDPILGLDDVAIAREGERDGGICNDHDGLEPPQVLVHSPRFRHLHAGPRCLRMLLQLHLKSLEQCHRVGRRTGKARNHSFLEGTDLARVPFHHMAAERDLSVPDDEHLVVLAHREDRCGPELLTVPRRIVVQS